MSSLLGASGASAASAPQPRTYRHLKPIVALDMPQPSMALGERAELCLLPLDRLVVDDRYQRAIGKQGRPNILRILAGFDWRKFTPVVVTPVGDGLYAIIDGQHRATAALMHPAIDMIPCMVVRVTPEEAAACFAAINGQVTTVTRGQIWKARVTSGDPAAAQIQRVLDAAEVRILAYKMPGTPYRKGDTLAVNTIEHCFRRHGPEILTLALQGVTQSGDGNPGCLVAPMIIAMCAIVAGVPELMSDPGRFFTLMDELNLERVLNEMAVKAKAQRRPLNVVLKEMLAGHLADALGRRLVDQATVPREEQAA